MVYLYANYSDPTVEGCLSFVCLVKKVTVRVHFHIERFPGYLCKDGPVSSITDTDQNENDEVSPLSAEEEDVTTNNRCSPFYYDTLISYWNTDTVATQNE